MSTWMREWTGTCSQCFWPRARPWHLDENKLQCEGCGAVYEWPGALDDQEDEGDGVVGDS